MAVGEPIHGVRLNTAAVGASGKFIPAVEPAAGCAYPPGVKLRIAIVLLFTGAWLAPAQTNDLADLLDPDLYRPRFLTALLESAVR